MARRTFEVPFAITKLDPLSAVPLYRQIYDELRSAILTGRLCARTRLPSTRRMAAELNISRNTIVNAYEQLLAEGYVEGEIGSGTYVTGTLPEELLNARASNGETNSSVTCNRELSQRGRLLASRPASVANLQHAFRPFRPGTPAIDEFPIKIWLNLIWKRWRRPDIELLGYGKAAGYQPLREAIATYLKSSRGVSCTADQVIIVAGSQQALDLAARVLLDPGDYALTEDPGYLGAQNALLGNSVNVISVPVDNEGIEINEGERLCSGAKLVYVTPSRQFPLGVTMSLARRLALLEWARRSGAWILENDYDCEYRYAGYPLTALQGLDKHGRVIYIGTFSKVMFPALRLGYMVVPPNLVDSFSSARALIDLNSPTTEQAVLADFISEGHFARHVLRMRKLYAERQAVLVESAAREFAGMIDLPPSEAGMHLIGWLPPNANDYEISQLTLGHGIELPPLSAYSTRPLLRSGLLFGYSALKEVEIRDNIQKLAKLLIRSKIFSKWSATK